MQIELAKKKIRDLSHLYQQGHEYRDYECEVVFDYLSGEKKRYVRISDGEVLERGLITADEWADYRQTKADFDSQPDAEDALMKMILTMKATRRMCCLCVRR